jgi:hypothetical protein
MPFDNPIVSGDGELVIDRIHSDNFITGVSGWDIEKTGLAEFQSLEARGDLSGSTITIPPNAGTGARIVIDNTGIKAYNTANQLVLELVPDIAVGAPTPEPGIIIGDSTQIQLAMFARQAPTAGGILQWFINQAHWKTAAFDVSLTGPAGGAAEVGTMTLSPPAPSSELGGLGNMQLQFQSESYDKVTNRASFIVQSNDSVNVGPVLKCSAGLTAIPSGSKFQVGNGFPGGAYSGNYSWAKTQTSSSVAPITAVAVIKEKSDYATPFTGGTFNVPVEGFYDLSMFVKPVAGITRLAAIILVNGTEVAHNESSVASVPANTVVLEQYLLPTDNVTFVPFQNSGVSANMAGFINIGRRPQ